MYSNDVNKIVSYLVNLFFPEYNITVAINYYTGMLYINFVHENLPDGLVTSVVGVEDGMMSVVVIVVSDFIVGIVITVYVVLELVSASVVIVVVVVVVIVAVVLAVMVVVRVV